MSGVCDTKDNECGYANGDGPCTAANGDVVCRSGTCSANGTCEPAGGCNVDADCTNASLPVCDTGTHQCLAASSGQAFSGGGFCTFAATRPASGQALLAGLALVLCLLACRAHSARRAFVRPRG